MPSIGVNVAIIQDDRILLTQRDDFEVQRTSCTAIASGYSMRWAVRAAAWPGMKSAR